MRDRAAQLRRNLEQVRGGIEDACLAAGRAPESVTLIAVSKTWPAADIGALRECGVVDFGENRADELARKAAELGDPQVRWHFIGQLQSKKAAAVAGVAAMVHSVDRESVLAPLDRGAAAAGGPLPVLLQVSLAELATEESSGRGGAAPAELPALAAAVAGHASLQLAGVMTLPPISVPPPVAFARLAELARALQGDFPDAAVISAGMSGDYRAAIAAGATHIRVGSAVFGERSAVR